MAACVIATLLYGDTPGQIFWVFLVFAHFAAVLTIWVSRLQALVRKAP